MPAAQIGLGLAALGRPAYINLGHGEDVADPSVDAMERSGARRARRRLRGRRALVRRGALVRSRRGVPRVVAHTAAGWERGDLVVSSKWGYRYTAGWRVDAAEHEVKDLSAEHLRDPMARDAGAARRAPGRLPDPLGHARERRARRRRGARASSTSCAREGIRIGLTVTGAEQAATIDRALDVGGFDTVQATWNLHERSAEDALARAHEAGLQVLVKEGLANGRLAGHDAPATLTAAARARGTSEDAVALAAALARPWADVVLSGATTVASAREQPRGTRCSPGTTSSSAARRVGRGAGGVLGDARRAPLDSQMAYSSSASNQSNVRVTAFFQNL